MKKTHGRKRRSVHPELKGWWRDVVVHPFIEKVVIGVTVPIRHPHRPGRVRVMPPEKPGVFPCVGWTSTGVQTFFVIAPRLHNPNDVLDYDPSIR